MAEYVNGTTDILGGSVIRYALNTTTPNQAVIRKIIAGNGITISSTGVDSGTGDVTISVDISGSGGGGTGGGGTGGGGSSNTGIGTVTSVNMTVPEGLTVYGTPITTAGTIALQLSSGYIIPLYQDVQKGISAYDNTVMSFTYNTSTGIITLVRRNGGSMIASITLDPFTTDDLVEGSTNLYFTDARARAAISETITGIDYNSTTGVFSLTSGYVIPTTTQSTNWNTAYDWVNAFPSLTGNSGKYLSNNGTTLLWDTVSSFTLNLTTIGNAGPATLAGSTLNIPVYTTTTDGLVSGGLVTWSGTGFIYDVSAAYYYLNSVYFTTTNTQVTLGAADISNPRLDIVAVNNLGQVVVIPGVPSSNPVKAQIDPTTQIELATILVPAGATSPVNILTAIIYDEVGNSTWSSLASGVTVDFANTTTPYTGSVTASVNASTTGTRYIQFSRITGTDSVSNYSVLKFAIRLGTAWTSTSTLAIGFYNNNTLISTEVSVLNGQFGFNMATTATYQLIQIPIANWRFTQASFNRIRFRFINSLPAFRLDRVELQAGVVQTLIQANNIYTSDGSLAGIRTLTLNGNYLDIVGSSATTRFNSDGSVSIGGTITATTLASGSDKLVLASATGVLSAVTIGTGLSYSGGILTATGTLTSASFATDYDNTVTGLRNSSNTVYTTSQNFVSGSTHVFVNGVRQSRGASYDYTETASNQITFNYAPDNGDLIVIDYIKS